VSGTLNCFIIICMSVYFIFIVHLLRREKFLLKYGILWIICGLVMSVFAVFPDMLARLTGFLGVKIASNGLFAISIFLIIVMLVFLTVVVTDFTIRIRKMAQKTAILEKRLRVLEDRGKDMTGDDENDKGEL